MRPKPRITRYIGLSTDAKPNADYGDTFREMDTGTIYMFDGETWHASSKEYEFSGDIVSFEAKKVTPMQSVVVSMEPVQDLHGQDAPYPAGGGKNKWNPQAYTGLGYNASVGTAVNLTEAEATVSGNAITYDVVSWGNRVFKTNPLTAGTYHLHFDATAITNARLTGFLIASDNTVKSATPSTRSDVFDLTFTVEAGEYIAVYIGSNTAQTISVTNWQIESGNAFTAWSPYSNICPISGRTGLNVYVSPTTDQADATTYPVSWESEAGTVYGGTLDVVSGTLTIDRYFVDPTQWTRYNANNGYIAYRNAGLPYGKYNLDLANEPMSNIISNFGGFSSSAMDKNIIQTPRLNSDSAYLALREDIDPTTVQLCYLIASPTTLTVDPHTIPSQLGDNNVWSDAGAITVKVKL